MLQIRLATGGALAVHAQANGAYGKIDDVTSVH